MTRRRPSQAVRGAALALLLVSCGGTKVAPIVKAPPKPEPPPLPACLVLSVGAEKGLAHLGVIQALQERNVKIDCVIGTSMGSLVGALYASSPDADTSEAYRALFQAYVAKTKSEATDRGIVGFLLGAALVVASGGAAAPALAAGAGAGALGAATTQKKDLDRLRVVMDEHFEKKRIEDLPLQYRTIHQRVGETGISKQPIRGGNLAEEVSWSIANPLIFPGIELESGARIDPGADSVAAIPLEYACREFPDHQFIVSNATGENIFTSKAMDCPYQEVRPEPVAVDRKKAIIAEDPEYSLLITSGRVAALAALRWDSLPPRPAHKKEKTHAE